MLRSLLFACLTVALATFAARSAAAASDQSASIIETPLQSKVTLPWSSSQESLQSRLFQAFAALYADASADQCPALTQEQSPEAQTFHLSGEATETQKNLGTAIVCESRQSLTSCLFQLPSHVLNWAESPRSPQAVLFASLVALHEKTQGALPGLKLSTKGFTRWVRLDDADSSSSIVCEAEYDGDGIANRYRCRVLIQP